MKVVFLDFNGVIDTYDKMDEIDLDNVNRLKILCELCNANVVFSSSIRYSQHGKIVMEKLINLGINIIGVTPKLGNREEEIKAYVSKHNISEYCVLDDDYNMESIKEHVVKLPVQGPGSLGFSEEYFNKAIKVLGLSIDEVKRYGK